MSRRHNPYDLSRTELNSLGIELPDRVSFFIRDTLWAADTTEIAFSYHKSRMSHVTMSHTSHVTHTNESCNTHECVISHTRMFERERFRLFHRRRRSDSVKFTQSRLSNFRQVYTGDPIHIKHVFLGVPKISNGFSKWVNGVPVTQKSVQENRIIWRSKSFKTNLLHEWIIQSYRECMIQCNIRDSVCDRNVGAETTYTHDKWSGQTQMYTDSGLVLWVLMCDIIIGTQTTYTPDNWSTQTQTWTDFGLVLWVFLVFTFTHFQPFWPFSFVRPHWEKRNLAFS